MRPSKPAQTLPTRRNRPPLPPRRALLPLRLLMFGDFSVNNAAKLKLESQTTTLDFNDPPWKLMRPVLALLDKGGVTGANCSMRIEPLRRDPNRPIVGYLRIPTGRHTNSIEESKALKSHPL
ncbi:hypothetical protein Ae201684P_007463 [Aphanomyces euteiches]|nr:hypothetical protein Ae201684P_007463 [Aphanomyces euteiches]